MRPLVLGASGFVGLNLVDALLSEGINPLCARRARSNVIPLRSRRASMVVADLDDIDSLQKAMDETDVVFHCAGHYPRLSLNPDAALETGRRQLTNVLNAASKTGVKRLIYVSSTATVAATDGVSDESDVFVDEPPFVPPSRGCRCPGL